MNPCIHQICIYEASQLWSPWVCAIILLDRGSINAQKRVSTHFGRRRTIRVIQPVENGRAKFLAHDNFLGVKIPRLHTLCAELALMQNSCDANFLAQNNGRILRWNLVVSALKLRSWVSCQELIHNLLSHWKMRLKQVCCARHIACRVGSSVWQSRENTVVWVISDHLKKLILPNLVFLNNN